jgi:hypothetical protein
MRHKSGRYYALIFAKGKETWKSLKTDLEVAEAKLRKEIGDIEKVMRASAALDRGRMRQKGFGLAGSGARSGASVTGGVIADGARNDCGLAFDEQWKLFGSDNDHESMPNDFAPGNSRSVPHARRPHP